MSILTGEVIDMADPLFDRPAFIEKVRQIFASLEPLLPEGDAFDYEETALFSGVVNESQEHLVIVPMTRDSVSIQKGFTLGEQESWADVGTLSAFAFLVMPPTDCIHTVSYDVPYLVRGTSWNEADVVDEHNTVIRQFVTWWHRGEPQKQFYKFYGNAVIHISNCDTVSMNQQ